MQAAKVLLPLLELKLGHSALNLRNNTLALKSSVGVPMLICTLTVKVVQQFYSPLDALSCD